MAKIGISTLIVTFHDNMDIKFIRNDTNPMIKMNFYIVKSIIGHEMWPRKFKLQPIINHKIFSLI